MPTVAPINLNTHPELSDEEFIMAANSIYYGQPWSPGTGGWQAQLQYLNSQGSRQAWIQSLFNNYQGNRNAGWFYNVPPWAWLVIVPVVVITAGVLLWRAWGKDLSAKSFGNNGGSDRF